MTLSIRVYEMRFEFENARLLFISADWRKYDVNVKRLAASHRFPTCVVLKSSWICYPVAYMDQSHACRTQPVDLNRALFCL